ncbi:MFS transporter [Tabrizicola sp.]|uniref:MFS transporter n=1 Tax=Tabrizicola sp. TaxID=2005166 RepID=UPI00286D20AE|nr:MFS transporter [Tabrizicola sp.]
MQHNAMPASGQVPFPIVPGRWIAMAVLLIAGFMNLIDVTIVNVALPSMQAAFDATSSQIEWVVAAYILFFALLLLPAGRLGDIIGRREMFIAGVTVFTIGSAFCGLAPSIETLVLARIVQAAGAAMMTPQTLAIVPVLFAPKERGAAFALVGLSAGLAAVAGPIAGGLLIGADIWGLGWRPIFLVNLPVGVFAILAALKYLPKVKGDAAMKNDYIGIAIAAVALLLVVFPLIEGRQVGWPWWCFAMMAASVPMTWAFVRWQFAQAARGAAQLVPVTLMRNRNFMVGTGLAAVLFAGVPSFFLVLAIYLQGGYGLSPLQSGLTTVPFSVGVLIASVIAGPLGPRWQRERITLGALLLMSAMLGLRMVVGGTVDEVVWSAFAVPLFIGGLGLGTSISPMFQTVLANVSGHDTGSASGALQSMQQVGAALGVAIVGEVFFSSLMRAGGDHLAYAGALRAAVLCTAISFGSIALLVWILPKPAPIAGRPPVAVD